MNWNDLKDLVAHHFDIGSHTETHSILTKVSSKQLVDELVGSKKMLEDKLGIKVTTFAYPSYAQNETVREAVKSAGYLGARAGWSKFNNSVDYIYQLKSQEAVNNPNPFSEKRLPDLP
jgi:peptidoglycan/xylan/chitin deacetylase (PgdA/CDA1 family)